jgi:hypothetical protein
MNVLLLLFLISFVEVREPLGIFRVSLTVQSGGTILSVTVTDQIGNVSQPANITVHHLPEIPLC